MNWLTATLWWRRTWPLLAGLGLGVVPFAACWWYGCTSEPSRFADWLQTGGVLGTGVVIIWYAWESRKMATAAQASADLLAHQMRQEADIHLWPKPLARHTRVSLVNVGRSPVFRVHLWCRNANPEITRSMESRVPDEDSPECGHWRIGSIKPRAEFHCLLPSLPEVGDTYDCCVGWQASSHHGRMTRQTWCFEKTNDRWLDALPVPCRGCDHCLLER